MTEPFVQFIELTWDSVLISWEINWLGLKSIINIIINYKLSADANNDQVQIGTDVK